MISKKDSKPLLIRNVIGNSIGTNPKPIYGNWITIGGLIIEQSGEIKIYAEGLDAEYDLMVVLNANNTTRQIKENTPVLYGEMPTSIFENGNYYVKKIFPEYNCEIKIGLAKTNAINIPTIYYLYNDQIVSFQLNYDRKTNVGYTPKNQFIPFDENSSIWYRRPSSITDVKHKIKLLGVENVGVSDWYISFKKLTFTDI